MRKSKRIDMELKTKSREMGLPFDTLKRLAVIEYLKNHFNINIENEELTQINK